MMDVESGHIELIHLGAAVVIGLINLIWWAAAAQPQRGLKWNIGPRDEPRALTGMAGRLERAFANFQETFPFFLALVVLTYLCGKAGSPLSLWGAHLYVVARALYVPLYAFGVPVARSLVWAVSLVGLILLIVALAT